MNNKNHGFTLIEMLVALFLLTLITATGYQGSVFFINKISATEKKLSREYSHYQGMQWLRRQIENADSKTEDSGSEYVVNFSGEEQNLSFMCKISSRKYSEDRTCNLRYINRESMVVITQSGMDGDAVNQSILLNEVKQFSMRYYGQKRGGGYRWHTNWLDENSLPVAVEVNAVTEHGNNSRMLAFVNSRK